MNLEKKVSVWLTINRACNLRCEWCYAKYTGFRSNDDMLDDIVEKALNVMGDLNVKSVVLIGGEPTVHPNFLSIVSMLANSGVKVKILTNVVKFSDEKFLIKSIKAGIGSLAISLKASNREDYVKFTGSDCFEKAIVAIKNINKHGVSNAINITACKDSFDNFQEMIDVVVENGGKTISIDTGRPIVTYNGVIMNNMGTPREMADFFINLHPMIKKSRLEFSFKIGIPLCLFPKSFLDEAIKEKIILSGCQMAMEKGLIIDTDGKIIPCNHMCHIPLGKIGEDFSNAEEYWQFRKRKDVSSFYDFNKMCPSEKCKDCEYWKFCGGGCKLYWLCYSASEMIG
jgi:radical SAM protein with 4Fe4S-binding SPASM domain